MLSVILERREGFCYRHNGEKRSCLDRGRVWSDAATSQGEPAAPRSWKRKAKILSQSLWGRVAPRAAEFQPSGQNCEVTDLHVLKPPIL